MLQVTVTKMRLALSHCNGLFRLPLSAQFLSRVWVAFFSFWEWCTEVDHGRLLQNLHQVSVNVEIVSFKIMSVVLQKRFLSKTFDQIIAVSPSKNRDASVTWRYTERSSSLHRRLKLFLSQKRGAPSRNELFCHTRDASAVGTASLKTQGSVPSENKEPTVFRSKWMGYKYSRIRQCCMLLHCSTAQRELGNMKVCLSYTRFGHSTFACGFNSSSSTNAVNAFVLFVHTGDAFW
jgi:hypothetical protein